MKSKKTQQKGISEEEIEKRIDQTKIEVYYDEECDCLHITFRRPDSGNYCISDEVEDNIIIDFSDKGEVIGVEILFVRETLKEIAKKRKSP